MSRNGWVRTLSRNDYDSLKERIQEKMKNETTALGSPLLLKLLHLWRRRPLRVPVERIERPRDARPRQRRVVAAREPRRLDLDDALEREDVAEARTVVNRRLDDDRAGGVRVDRHKGEIVEAVATAGRRQLSDDLAACLWIAMKLEEEQTCVPTSREVWDGGGGPRAAARAPAALHAQALEDDLDAATGNLEGRAGPERVLLARGSAQLRVEDAVLRDGEDFALDLQLLRLWVVLLRVERQPERRADAGLPAWFGGVRSRRRPRRRIVTRAVHRRTSWHFCTAAMS